jgi:hypothetical protein
MSEDEVTSAPQIKNSFLQAVENHNNFPESVHPPKPDELQRLRDVLGESFTVYLAKLRAPLYVFNKISNVGTVGIKDEEGGSRVLLPIHQYTRTDYATLMGDRIIFIDTWRSRKNKKKNEKIARFDFMMLEDWVNSTDLDQANTREISSDRSTQGMYSKGIGFLKTLRGLMLNVQNDCTIHVHSANMQRERVYRKAFAGRENFVIHKNEIDAASPLKKLLRQIKIRASSMPENE